MEDPNDDEETGQPKKKQKKVKPGSFQGLGLSQATYKAIMRMGYNIPTPIQRKTIPTILEGQDLVAMARTGSGKTAAFLIPIIERLKSHSVSVGFRAIVLSPTRELAMQTAKFSRQLGRYTDLRCCLLLGGQGMEAQFEHLANNPDIIIATPGRLMHHILEAKLSLSRVEMLVFDEADRLFELGFAEQLQKILEATPLSRQCLLFSATLPAQLVSFSRAGIKDPAFIRLDVETTLSESLDLWYLFVRKEEKLAAAISVLRRMHQENKTTIMFVATRHHVEFFGELLQQLGLPASVIYGSMDQVARQDQVARFRHKKARILVTTDVAARGVDIPLLDHVINYDFPASAKLFVHRCGRTARAGRSGLAASLVSLEDLPYTVELMTFLGSRISVASPPSADDAEATSDQKTPVLGSLPALDHEVETLNALLAEEGTLLKSLHKSMIASYNLYNKTRPSASRSSVSRSKALLEECGGPARLQGLIHPAFRDESSLKQHGQLPGSVGSSDLSYIQELRGFRPKAEKLGNVISCNAMRTMEQAKLDASAVAAARTSLSSQDGLESMSFGGSSSSSAKGDVSSSKTRSSGESQFLLKRRRDGRTVKADKQEEPMPTAKNSTKPRPHLSKAARKRLKKAGVLGKATNDMGEDEEFDVKVDGSQWRGHEESTSKKSKKPQQPQFYLSTARDPREEAKERGLDMEQYQLDLMPDDSTDIKKAKSVMRWDARKKKYLPTMVSVDGRVVKGQRRNESGKKVKGDAEKSGIYAKWVKATKKTIPKVGELENPSSGPLGKRAKGRTVEFGAGGAVSYSGDGDDGGGAGESDRSRKPVVPFHGTIEDKYLTHKQKRLLKKRAQKDQGITTGTAKQELKTPQQIQQEKKYKEKMKLKQKPFLRKERNRQKKEARMKRMEDKSLKYGARTRAKMLIIEGSNKWKKSGPRPQNGYGSRRS